MGKVVISPSLRWPGQVSVSSPLTLPQALEWEKAIRTAQSLEGDITITDINAAMIPGILACIETWELEGLDPDKFPASPRAESRDLISWLVKEITSVYVGEEEKSDPNE